MDIEFHYWITGIIALKAGFNDKESNIIAYSSQYVDDNDRNYKIVDKKKNKKPYNNFVSQTMNILKPKPELFQIYPVFHFVPGDPTFESCNRRDGKLHILCTTPNGCYANEMLDAAFKAPHDTRLYRIGIATHAFSDTWSHQNFVGWYDYYNQIGLDPKPDIGHADAEFHPDMMGHEWDDLRLVESNVNNNHRFMSAAKSLFEKYCAYLKAQGRPNNSGKWPSLKKSLNEMIGSAYTETINSNERKEKRIKMYKEFAPALPEYDEWEWFNSAIESKVIGLRDNSIPQITTIFKDKYSWKKSIKKQATHWYKFQEAVKEHEKFGVKLLSPVFKKMDVNLLTDQPVVSVG
jgi:hypothetical protein